MDCRTDHGPVQNADKSRESLGHVQFKTVTYGPSKTQPSLDEDFHLAIAQLKSKSQLPK